MIKINIKHLTPEGVKIEGDEDANILKLDDDINILGMGKIYYKLKGYIVRNGVLVIGEVKITLLCRCSLCLKEYSLDLTNNNICHFYEKPVYDEIDLTDDIREDILIEFPIAFRCSEKCRGICCGCGRDLNVEDCKCGDDDDISLSDNYNHNNIWKELERLSF